MLTTVRWHWPILLILLLAIVVRLPLLTGSFWMDEAAQAIESARPWSVQLHIRDDFQPPLLHLITAAAIRFDQSEWWLRLWGALIPGLLSIVFTYTIGVELGHKAATSTRKRHSNGRAIGSIAALLLATSSFHIFYSQELRPYALPTLWATVSWWMLLRQHYWPGNTRRWWAWGMGWSTVSLLGLYSSYLYPFLLLAQVVFILIRSIIFTRHEQAQTGTEQSVWQTLTVYGSPMLPWLLLVLGIQIGFLAWLPSFLDQLSAGQLLRLTLPGWETVVATPQLKALALVGGKFLFGVIDLNVNVWFFLLTGLVAFLFLGVIWCWLRLKRGFWPLDVLLLITWLFIPLLTAWLVSFAVPVLQPKRVLYLLPAWYLSIGFLTAPLVLQSKRRLARWIGLTLIAVLLFSNIVGTVVYWRQPQLQREDWRQLWQQIDALYGDATPKLFIFDGPFASWEWYDIKFGDHSQKNDYSFMGDKVATPVNTTLLVEQATNGYTQPRIIYFDYLTDLTDPQRLVIRELESHHYRPTDLLDYPGIGFIRIFERQDSEAVAGGTLPLYY